MIFRPAQPQRAWITLRLDTFTQSHIEGQVMSKFIAEQA